MAEHRPDQLRILLAEDDELNAVVLQGMIHRLGHHVCWVDSGQDALNALRDGEYDLVLMDIMMPDMDGLEAVRIIRGKQCRARHLPVFALSALDDRSSRDACLDAGMDGHIAKPVDSRELESVLAGVAAKRSA